MRRSAILRKLLGRRTGPAVASLLVIATLGVATPTGGSASATNGLHPGSVVTSRVVVQVDMGSWTTGLGVAVVTAPGAPAASNGHEYLVSTTDGGVRWTVRSTYVQAVGNWYDAPTLLVARNGDLYAADTYASRLDLSTDGGMSWAPLHLAGHLESAKVLGGTLWTTVARCRGNGKGELPTCTSQLDVYRLGQLTPVAVHTIPGSTQHVESGVAIFGVVGHEGAVVVEGFSQAYWPQVRFVETVDGGATWRSAVDPCARALPGKYEYQFPQPFGLDASPGGRWTLYCTVKFLGISGGYNALYTSTTAGRSWRVLSRSALPGVRPVGRLDDVAGMAFAMSNDGRYLWKLSQAAVGQTAWPASESADGGRLWTSMRSPSSAGSRSFDPVGPRGAFFASLAQGLWRTEDGVHWTFLR